MRWLPTAIALVVIALPTVAMGSDGALTAPTGVYAGDVVYQGPDTLTARATVHMESDGVWWWTIARADEAPVRIDGGTEPGMVSHAFTGLAADTEYVISLTVATADGATNTATWRRRTARPGAPALRQQPAVSLLSGRLYTCEPGRWSNMTSTRSEWFASPTGEGWMADRGVFLAGMMFSAPRATLTCRTFARNSTGVSVATSTSIELPPYDGFGPPRTRPTGSSEVNPLAAGAPTPRALRARLRRVSTAALLGGESVAIAAPARGTTIISVRSRGWTLARSRGQRLLRLRVRGAVGRRTPIELSAVWQGGNTLVKASRIVRNAP